MNLSNLLSSALKEFIKKRESTNRTAKQKTALVTKRIVGSTIFVIILAAGWVIITLLSINQNNIATYFQNSSSGVSSLMKFLPKLGISVVNALFPALTLKITNIENWDSSSFIIKIQIIRLYLAKVLNVILYAGLNLELATDNAWFGSSSSRIPFDSSTYNCREDQAGLGLIILVFSEFVTSKVIPLLTVFFY